MMALAIAARVNVARIDEAGPLVETQDRLARLRRLMLLSGWLLGASWWLIWAPFAAVLLDLAFGIDLFEAADLTDWLLATLGVGAAGYAGMALLRLWASRTGRRRLADGLDNMLTGAAVREAQACVDEIARFAGD